MKKLALSALMLALVSAYPALAVEEHHPDQKPGAGATQAAPAKPAADQEKAVQKLKDNTKKLQAQLDKIGKTKDPKERQKLAQEHMQTMQESMMVAGAMSGDMMGGGMMRSGMMGCPMMSGMMGGGQGGMMGGGMMGMMHGGPGGGMMGGGAGGPGADPMMGRMQQMEKRMDMMQMMMEQMLKGQPSPAQK